MLLRTIRSRLLGLVVATVFPFFAVICIGLWSQLRDDQNRALERALDEARLVAIQVDDHIGSLENLLTGLSRAVSTRLADADANNALLRQGRCRDVAKVARKARQHCFRRFRHGYASLSYLT